MLIRRIQSSGWFSESIMCFEIPWIFIMIIQARTSCYLVTHGCLSILTRTQREGQGKKNLRERDDNGKTGQNIFACCVVPKYQVCPHTARMWLRNAGSQSHFPSFTSVKEHLKHTHKKRASLSPPPHPWKWILSSVFFVCKACFSPLLTPSTPLPWERPPWLVKQSVTSTSSEICALLS